MKTTLMLATWLAGTALTVGAQDMPGDTQNSQMGPPSHGHRPPPPAIIAAIDANHDGVITADEITNAAAVLKTLDKNGDGVLTPDEFVGHRPHRPSSDTMDGPPSDQGNRPEGAGPGGPPDDFAGPPEGMPPGPPPDGA